MKKKAELTALLAAAEALGASTDGPNDPATREPLDEERLKRDLEGKTLASFYADLGQERADRLLRAYDDTEDRVSNAVIWFYGERRIKGFEGETPYELWIGDGRERVEDALRLLSFVYAPFPDDPTM